MQLRNSDLISKKYSFVYVGKKVKGGEGGKEIVGNLVSGTGVGHDKLFPG